jgi:hypothetical protein
MGRTSDARKNARESDLSVPSCRIRIGSGTSSSYCFQADCDANSHVDPITPESSAFARGPERSCQDAVFPQDLQSLYQYA